MSSLTYSPTSTNTLYSLIFRSVGFMCVSTILMQKGHGVPPQLVQAILDVGHEFFSLPEAQKLQIGMNSTSAFRYCHSLLPART